MNRLARMQPRQWLIIALVLIATGALTLLLRDLVREMVVIPLTYAVWMGDIALRTIPQGLLLALLVLIGLFFVLRSAMHSTGDDQPLARGTVPASQQHSRLVFWARQLNRMEDSQFAVEKLALELKALIVRILSSQGNLPEDDVIDAVQRGNLAVPDEVRSLLIRPQDWLSATQPGQWELLLRWLRPNRTPVTNDAQSKKIDAVIHFIETRVNSEQP